MFRAVFPSIIRSSKLNIRQQAYVKQLLPHVVNIGTAPYFGDDDVHNNKNNSTTNNSNNVLIIIRPSI